MVEAVRQGQSQHDVAHAFHVSQSTVQYWVQRSADQALDEVDWFDRSHQPRAPLRTPVAVEDLVLAVRRELAQESDLGFHGAEMIHAVLRQRQVQPLPSVRTINRILRRRGAFDGQRRVRRAPPPLGWYLLQVAAKRAELDSFDIVEGLVIKGGPQVEVLNGVSLHGGLAVSWPVAQAVTAKFVVKALIEHWQQFGLPSYAQFDNDTVFQGPHTYPDVIGRVARLCLSLGVIPVFVPIRETGFQAGMESYNGTWQAKVWVRFRHSNLQGLHEHSRRYQEALRVHRAERIEAAPPRRGFPKRWRLDLQAPLQGCLIYLRRTNGAGEVEVLGRSVLVDPQWPHRLVRAEVDLERGEMRFYRLRRRTPKDQPLIKRIKYKVKRSKFTE